MIPASFEFSVAVRRALNIIDALVVGSPSRIHQLAIASGWGKVDPIYGKRQSACFAFRANMEASIACGHGNRAAKRAARLQEQQGLAEVYTNLDEARLTEAEVDELARIDSARHGVPHEL